MNKKEIPLLYKIILKKFWSESMVGRLKISKARWICSWYFRMGKFNWNDIYFDLIQRNYIKVNGRKGGVVIIVPLKDLC